MTNEITVRLRTKKSGPGRIAQSPEDRINCVPCTADLGCGGTVGLQAEGERQSI